MTRNMNTQASLHRWLSRQALPPSLYHLLVVAAVIVCGLVYLQAVGAARAADTTDGFTLLLAGSPLSAVGQIIGLTVPPLAIALAITAVGRPGTAVVVMGAGLAVAVCSAGSIEQWLRQPFGTSVYWYFAAEALTWAALWLAVVLVIYHFNAYLQRLAPERVDGLVEGEAEMPEPAWWGAADAMEGRSGIGAELLAAAVCVVVGSLGVAVLVRTAEWPQVAWGVGLSFLVAGLIAHQASPVRSPVVFALSPMIAGFGWYLYIAMQGAGPDVVQFNYFTGQYWPAGLVMPGYYASAGVAGVMLGRAWSQSMLRQHWLEE